MSSTLIVLNGPSSSGKSSIISSLQDLWPRPLFASGLDVFIGGWPDSHVTLPDADGSPASESAMRIVAGIGPAPSWVPEYGDGFHHIMKFAHELWAAMNNGGIDLVIDHVILDTTLREQARSTLIGAFWVGVTCDIEELVRRETARRDRRLGFASGTAAVVHNEMEYDLVVDTTLTPPEVVARQIFDAVYGWANAKVDAMTSWGAGHYGNPCRGCNFAWDLSAADAVTLVEALPGRYGVRLETATGNETCRDLAWSVSAYVSHVSDNLRIWSERLAGARLSDEGRVAGYDGDLLSVARRYHQINLRAALWSLEGSVREWSQSIRAALEAGTVLHHSERGRQSAEDVARNNAHDAVHHLWDIERILSANH